MSQRYIGGLIYNPPGGFSGAFDGSGDYLQLADSTAWDLTGDYTIEMWLFKNASASQTFFQLGTSSNILLYQNASNQIIFYSGAAIITASVTASLNTWNHVALVRSGSGSNNTVLYLNGVNVGQATNTTSFTGDASNGVRIGAEYPTGFEFNGYISNVRVVKGTALYTAAFTPPNGPLQAVTNTQLLTCAYGTFRDGSTNNFTITVNGNTAVSAQNPFPLTTLPNPALGGQGNGVYSMTQYQALKQQNLWPAGDPYWRYVTLMLHGNGTNGAQNNTFLDSSTNNFTITRNGNTTQGTFAPFGNNWSNYFDGTGDYITSSQSQTIPATGDFTIDGWFWCNTYTNYPSILSQGTSGNAGRFNIYINNDGKFGVQIGATANNIGSAVPTNQWVHFAVTRSGSTVTVYINGASIGTATNGTSVQNTTPSIGSEWSGDPYRWIGYLSNIRVSNVVRTISLPASPFVADANTVLLTCQSNRFIDTSTTAATLTPNGNVSVQRFSPFNPTAPYAAGTDGGSGYFDGTLDYLVPSSGASTGFDLGVGATAFTLEMWVYITGTGFQHFFSKGGGTAGWNSTTGWQYTTYYYTDGSIYFDNWNGSTFASSGASLTSNGGSRNGWTHLVFAYNGTTKAIFINGTRATSTSATFAKPSSSTNPPAIGSPYPITGETYHLQGYMAGLRVVNGTDVYGVGNTTITVPSAPPAAITNTQLLTNFTNAGIIDNAEMNNLETVGNAQISTAQSKFGGASMYFDGTGDWLVMPSSPNLAFGTGNFTVEFWINSTSFASTPIYLDFRNTNGSASGLVFYVTTGGAPVVFISSAIITGSSTMSTATFYHIAVVRSGSTITCYLNGTSVGSASNSTNLSDSKLTIGSAVSNTNLVTGYIDDLRITKGYARYTTSFTPQRSQWQDQ